MKWVRRFGESFNMDSEQEMYFIEKKKQTNPNKHGICSRGKDLYIKYQLYILITIWKHEATVLHFLPWFSIGMCECVWVCVCVSLFHFPFYFIWGWMWAALHGFQVVRWGNITEIEWKWAEIWKRFFSDVNF